jgi:hypothetical protein
MWNKIITLIPSVLTIPAILGAILYAIFLPETAHYALGIYLDLWFPLLKGFWGYPIFFLLLMIPFVSMVLIALLSFQSFHVLFQFVFGLYDPSFHGFVTMFPATLVIITLALSLLLSNKE